MHPARIDPPEVRHALHSNVEALAERLRDLHPEDGAELAADLSAAEAVSLIELLPREQGAELLVRLTPEHQQRILQQMTLGSLAGLIRQMAPDDRVDVLQTLQDNEATAVLQQIERVEPAVAANIRRLDAFDSDSAGGRMTTDFFALLPETKVWRAVEALRRSGRSRRAEFVYTLYVCTLEGRLLGVVSLRELMLAEANDTLEQIMERSVVSVAPTDDQERVATIVARYDFSALPVVDKGGVMLGVVTVDDMVDVVIEEATEDAQMAAAVLPLEAEYFATGLGEMVWKRAAWLIVLFLGQLLTANVMQSHESTLAVALDLVLFVPLIIASGGNAGSQSSSLIIRALATGEVVPLQWYRVFRRELAMGLSLGVILGIIGFLRALMGHHQLNALDLGVTVGLSIVAVVVLGTLMGSLLPLLIRRVGLDPAVSSTPFIASLVDVLGLLVYFAVARYALGLG